MKFISQAKRFAPLGVALATALLTGAAQAVPVNDAKLKYEREKADCMMGRTAEPRATCLKEAGAAYAEARRGRLVSSSDASSQWSANAAKRCEVQKGDMRDLCLRRVAGEGTVYGSVAAGGKLDELITTSPTAAGPQTAPPPPPPAK